MICIVIFILIRCAEQETSEAADCVLPSRRWFTQHIQLTFWATDFL